MNGDAVAVPASVQEAFDQASDIMSRAFPSADVDLANPPIADVEEAASAGVPESRGLGTGLGARVPPADAILEILLEDIAPDPAQARDEGADDSIGDTLKPTDVLPAIELRVHPMAGQSIDARVEQSDGKTLVYPPYMVIDGERRWRGSKKAGRTTIRAWVNPNPGDDGDRLLRQAVLNEGERLKPMEEARTWARIRAAKGWNIQQLAEAVKRPKSTVSDRLAMLDAPAPFQKLFADGTLRAAAAPIVREYREIPERILKAAVKTLLDDEYEGWGQFAGNGVPVPVKVVEETLENEIVWGRGENNERHVVEIDKSLAKKYSGPVATIGKKKYAVDVDAYSALEARNAHSSRDDAPMSREEERYRREASERNRREREAFAKKRALKRARFDAIVAKLPTSSFDADWFQFVVTYLVDEMHQDALREACNALEIESVKKGPRIGYQFSKAVVAHSAQLSSAAARMRFAVQLLLCAELHPNSFTPPGQTSRFAAAAKLLKLDLSKIKPPADEKAKKAPAKPSAKKRR